MHIFKSTFASVGLAAALMTASGTARADRIVLQENFDGPGIPQGWLVVNNSMPVGATSWFKGDPLVFPAQSGAANSYLAANFLAAGIGGNVRDWLLLPTQTYYAGDLFSFFTRTETNPVPGDRLQVRLSTNGMSSNLADFTQILFDTATIRASSYPEAWTQFTRTLPAFTGRLAFLYLVDDTSANGDYIGIDSVAVISAIPEPEMSAMFALGATALALSMRRAARRRESLRRA